MERRVPGVLIVGGGLAGALLALELRRRGLAVSLLAPARHQQDSIATALSYGAIPGWPLAPTPLARAAASAGRRWRQLQRCHGDLGWRPVRLRLRGAAAAPQLAARLGLLPVSQVDPQRLMERLPLVLAAAGVERLEGEALPLQPAPGGGWRVDLAAGGTLLADQLVLAAGPVCRRLWPALPASLRTSWAGVLELPASPALAQALRADLLLPGQFRRIPLERSAAALEAPAWVVDAGLVRRAGGALLGQLSWIPAAGDDAAAAAGPPPERAQLWLRQALSEADPALAALAAGGRYRQLPVAFSADGLPLAAPLAPGLWLFSGFSGAFGQVPLLAPLLAAAISAAITAEEPTAGVAVRELRRLGVWPAAPTSSAGG